ncbi:MAG: hypothetical protein AAF570_14890 [Bacteroidota bacterium]
MLRFQGTKYPRFFRGFLIGLASLLFVTALPAQSVSRRKLKKAKNKAIRFLKLRLSQDDFAFDSGMVLIFLARKFDLNMGPDFDAFKACMIRELPTAGDDADIFLRLYDPTAKVAVGAFDHIEETDTDYLIGKCLHCDDWPDKHLRALIRAHARRDGYVLTHAAVGFQWALEHGCLPDDRITTSLKAYLIRELGRYIPREGLNSDQGIEAFAFWLYLHGPTKIPDEWLQKLVANQMKNGAWALESLEEDGGDHTAVLGLWCLLECLFPETPAVPWMQPH